jgi:GDSL-like lipase/acylhydrolase family protein
MRALLGGLLVLCMTVLVCCAALEVGLRLLRVYPSYSMPDRTIGFRLRPGARYRFTDEGGSEGRINSRGWRDREHTLSKPPGVTRIEVIGDSFVEAFQVPADSAFPALLERRLGRGHEVVALGRSGMGTTEEYLTYRRWGAEYDPDVVAVLFVMNDLIDNTRELDPSGGLRPYFVLKGDSLVLDTTFVLSPGFRSRAALDGLKARSSLVTWAVRSWNQMRQTQAMRRLAARTRHDDVSFDFDRRLPPDSLAAFRITRQVLARFADQVHRDGRRFVLFVAGAAQQEDRATLSAAERNPAYDRDKPQRFLEACGAADGYDVVPLTPAFREASAAGGGPYWFVVRAGYAHWNARGHDLAAREMERYFAGPPGTAAPAASTRAPVAPARHGP